MHAWTRCGSLRVVRLHRDPLQGAISGLLAGLVGAWSMNVYWSALATLRTAAKGRQTARDGSSEESATVRAASALARTATHHHLTREQKAAAGPIVHYTMGAVSGALYGAVAERAPERWLGRGLSLGLALWLGADETAVPLLRLAHPPSRVPLSVHAQALGAHLVYGWTTDLVRRVVRLAW
jgi:putative membrane protein